MHYSSQFKKSTKTKQPAWFLPFTGMVIILYVLIFQEAALRAYYETWMQKLPQRQILEGVSQKELETGPGQKAVPAAILTSPVLLPSYADQTLRNEAEISQPFSTPSPDSIAQPAENAELSVLEPSLIPDRLVIPAIEVDAEVIRINPERTTVEGISQMIWPVPPADKAGWHSTSAQMSAAGNTVINGHNYPQDAIFRSLYKVQPGDQILLYARNRMVEYIVVEILILPEQGQSLEVRQNNARYIQPTKGEHLTLVTCHPYASLANRLVVIAVPAETLIGIMK